MADKMSLREKLVNIQNELKAPKGQYNSFGKYAYRSCEDILEAVKPLCLKYKVTLTVCDSISQYGERFYIKAIASLCDCESEEVIENVAYAREEENIKGMAQSQITGATSSYARKYALNGLFCIDDTKDADTDEHKKQQEKGNEKEPTQPKLATENQVKIITDLYAGKEDKLHELLTMYKVNAIKELTLVQASDLIKKLQEKAGKTA